MNLIEKLKNIKLANPIAVVGMGVSGRSVFQYLHEAGYQVQGFDEKIKDSTTKLLDLANQEMFLGYGTLVVSPGIDRRVPAIVSSTAEVMNDVELFARLVEKPVAAVTGSNGKSTVVTMLAEGLSAQGLNVRLCGNIGRPVIEALFDAPEKTDVYVLELSSYQLEICPSLQIEVGAVLNVTPDHLDRYDSYQDYVDAKANLARQARLCLLNVENQDSLAMRVQAGQVVLYGSGSGNEVCGGEILIGGEAVMQTATLQVHGKHNFTNALVALLMAKALGQSTQRTVEVLQAFRGLPHRMALVGIFDGVRWIDDSKATNIGATAAALVGATAPVWLIVGGVGKDQDFNELAKIILQTPIKGVLMIGVDNQSMMSAFNVAGITYQICGEMAQAVAQVKAQAQSGDWVLLSPATASFDQFNNYCERGDCFADEVNKQCL